MSALLLEIRGLTVRFGAVPVVRDLSLSLAASERLAIIGESGSGKSITALSVLRLLDGAARTEGQILLKGEDLLQLPARAMQRVRGARIAMVFQDPATSLNPAFTIGRQIRDVLRAHGRDAGGDSNEAAAALLDQVGIREPRHCLTLYPHELSGGMRQRVGIALAVACDPQVLIADEPTTALDVTVQVQITRLLVNLCERRGIGLIFISHNLDLVGEFADRIAVMHRGELVECGAAAQVMGAPKAAYTRQLLAAIPRLGSAPVRAPATGAAVLETRSLAKDYPVARGFFARLLDRRKAPALAATDLSVARGEILGVVGESGSGKTTLARLLIGLGQPSAGAVLLDGQPLAVRTRRERVALGRRVQMVFQGSHTSLNPRKTIRRALTEAMRAAEITDPQPLVALMAQVALDPALLDRYPHQLSGGQRQRVGIARALSVRPQILIADEPTSALDVSIQKEVIELLQRLHAETGMTMIVISHDLGLIGTICDRVVVMRGGEIVEEGEAAAVLTAPQHDYTRSLINAVPKGLSGRARYARAAAVA